MQQRRTVASNPGSLPLTSQDLTNGNSTNKKQSHRSRLKRGGKKPRNSTYFTIGLLTVLLIALVTVSLSIYFFFGTDKLHNSHHHHRTRFDSEWVAEQHHRPEAAQRYRTERQPDRKLNHHNQHHNHHEHYRHPPRLEQGHRHGGYNPARLHHENKNRRRRVSPEDEWKHYHSPGRRNGVGEVNEEQEEDYENRHNMMHFRPDMNAAVNVDREKIIQEQMEKAKNGNNNGLKKFMDKVHEKNEAPSEPNNNVADNKNDNNNAIVDENKDNINSVKSLNFFQNNKNLSQKTEFIGLYFASSWCPQSTPATDALENAFASSTNNNNNDNILLTPKLFLQDTTNSNNKKQIGIIYISSDRTNDEYKKFINKHNHWLMPYNNDSNEDEEIIQLKRMFHTCAEEEESKFETMERKYGIPRLIIIDSDSMNVITTDGIVDVLNDGIRALERWKDLKKNMVMDNRNIVDEKKKSMEGEGVGDKPNIVTH